MGILRPQRFRVLVSVLIGTVGVAASLAFVWISKKVVDVATGAEPGDVTTLAAVLIGIMLVQLLFRVGARYWEGYFVVRTQNLLRSEVFRKVMVSTWNGKDRLHSGDTVSRLEEDIRVVVDFLCVTLPDVLITVIQLLAASAYLFVLSPNLAWILLVIMPGVTIPQCILIYAFTTLFANMLFFMPLQLGGREGGFLMSTEGLSMTANAGIFVALLVRLRELIWTAIGLLLIKLDKKEK